MWHYVEANPLDVIPFTQEISWPMIVLQVMEAKRNGRIPIFGGNPMA
jgi:hypothetical protein